jgi:ribosomal-protein-serine acetyltransferase
MNPPSMQPVPSVLALGENLRLRLAEVGDAEAVFAVVDANREHLRVWLPWVDGSREAAGTRTFLENDVLQRAAGSTATYMVLSGGSITGFIGLHEIDWLNSSFLIGYWIAKDHEGHGIITRACGRLLSMAFDELGMERAVIRCAVGNTRSSAVPKRLGFTFEGVERNAQRLNGRFVDLERYSLLRGEL